MIIIKIEQSRGSTKRVVKYHEVVHLMLFAKNVCQVTVNRRPLFCQVIMIVMKISKLSVNQEFILFQNQQYFTFIWLVNTRSCFNNACSEISDVKLLVTDPLKCRAQRRDQSTTLNYYSTWRVVINSKYYCNELIETNIPAMEKL